MNFRRETGTDRHAIGQPQGFGVLGVPERYVAGVDIRGRPEVSLYPWSKQAIHEISGLGLDKHKSD